MRRLGVALAGLAALVLGSRTAAAGGEPIVILLSWDGMRHDYPDWGEFPALHRMMREGARVERLVPPFPSLTFPSHVSLATGTHPDRHGIVANEFWDGERHFDYSSAASFIEAEPLWVAAERQGVRSAVFFWVGSEVDWRGLGASYRVAPFDASIGETEKVDRLLHWLDLPAKQAPRLLMAWWHGADAVGHRRGPHRSDIAAQVAEQDAELGRLLAGIDARGLWPRTTLLVVSDHGMALATQRLDPEAALAEAGIEARVARAGGCAFVYLEDPGQREAARRALSGLDRTSVYARDEIPARLRVVHGERSGDLLLVTEPPATFARLDGWKTWLLAFGRLIGRGAGMHGYDPAHPDMGGVALALGRGVPAGARPEAWHAVDVAPTVAALLGIEAPAQAEGRVRLTAAQP